MKILFTGGGTGGHTIPTVAIVRELRRLHGEENLHFFYIGPKDDFSGVFLSQEDVRIKHVLAGKIRRYYDWKSVMQNIIDVCMKIPIGAIQSFFYLFFFSPDVVLSQGGFGSIPVVIAAKLLMVEVFLHESDVTPGMANRFLSRFTSNIFVSFPHTEYFPFKKMILIGNPIRKEILNGSKEEARIFFKVTSFKPVILILGGSQGAQRINDKIIEILPTLLDEFELILQCGDKNLNEVKATARSIMKPGQEIFLHTVSFLKEPELNRAYAIADIIVSRAGSGSIFEIAAVGKPSILIPLPESAQNHQVKNAYAFAKDGAAIVMEENNFTARFFLQRIKSILNSDDAIKMEIKAKRFAKPEAAKNIANYILEYLTGK